MICIKFYSTAWIEALPCGSSRPMQVGGGGVAWVSFVVGWLVTTSPKFEAAHLHEDSLWYRPEHGLEMIIEEQQEPDWGLGIFFWWIVVFQYQNKNQRSRSHIKITQK